MRAWAVAATTVLFLGCHRETTEPPVVSVGQVIKIKEGLLVGDGKSSLVRAGQLHEADDMAGIEAMRKGGQIGFPRAGTHARVISTAPELTELKIISGHMAGTYGHVWTSLLRDAEPGDPDEERKATEAQARYEKNVATADRLHRAIAAEIDGLNELAVFATDEPDKQERTVSMRLSTDATQVIHMRLRKVLPLCEASINESARGAKSKTVTMLVHTPKGRFGKYVVGPAVALPPYHSDFLEWQE